MHTSIVFGPNRPQAAHAAIVRLALLESECAGSPWHPRYGELCAARALRAEYAEYGDEQACIDRM